MYQFLLLMDLGNRRLIYFLLTPLAMFAKVLLLFHQQIFQSNIFFPLLKCILEFLEPQVLAHQYLVYLDLSLLFLLLEEVLFLLQGQLHFSLHLLLASALLLFFLLPIFLKLLPLTCLTLIKFLFQTITLFFPFLLLEIF